VKNWERSEASKEVQTISNSETEFLGFTKRLVVVTLLPEENFVMFTFSIG